jgi:WD40 repeat protein
MPVPPNAALLPPFKIPKIPEIPKQTGTLRIWNSSTGEMLANVQGPEGLALHLVFSPDGKRVAAGNGSVVTVRDAANAGVVLTSKGSLVAFLPDSRRVLVGAALGFEERASLDTDKVKVLDTQDRQELRSFGRFRALLAAMALSHDGHRLATVDQGGFDEQFQRVSPALRLWDVDTGHLVFSKPLENGVFRVAFGPDDQRLVVPLLAKEIIKVWDAETGQEQPVTFQGHGAVWSGNGALVATTCVGGVVKLWEATTGKELYTLEGEKCRV